MTKITTSWPTVWGRANSPEAFVADMKEAAILVGAIRSIVERREGQSAVR
jgi:hypothetical protein